MYKKWLQQLIQIVWPNSMTSMLYSVFSTGDCAHIIVACLPATVALCLPQSCVRFRNRFAEVRPGLTLGEATFAEGLPPEAVLRIERGGCFQVRALQLSHGFNQSLDNVTLPSGLRSLTFGFFFNQSLDNTTLPSGLQSVTFGKGFHLYCEF